MNSLRYTLLTDGSSDRALIPILNWLLQQHLPDCAIKHAWADLAKMSKPPSRKDLPARIECAVSLYPCDLLFIHRDAENCELEDRIKEIEDDLGKMKNFDMPTIKVIPVRMTEAWLLFNEDAIRTTASNPNGNVDLTLPKLNYVENLPDPKIVLHETLKRASQLSGRRLKNFKPHSYIHRIAQLIDDFSYLRDLSAFCAMENELKNVLDVWLTS